MVLTLPAVFLLLEDLRRRSIFGSRDLWKALWPYAALSGIFLIIALFGKQDIVTRLSVIQTALMACKSTMIYFQKLVWPNAFSVIYPQVGPINFGALEFQLAVSFMVALLAFVFVSRRWSRLPSFALGAFLITVLPTYSNFSKGGDIFFASDRYAYMPSVFLFILIAAFFYWLVTQRWAIGQAAQWILGIATFWLLLGLGWKSHAQSLTW